MLLSLRHLYHKLYRKTAAGHEILEAKKDSLIRFLKNGGAGNPAIAIDKSE